MPLERVESKNEVAQWIRDGTDRVLRMDDPNWRGNFVSHCVPPIFAGYCKLFHPTYTDASVPPDSGSWAAAEGSADKTCRLVSVPTDSGPHGRRVRWRELADKYGLRFHAAFNDQSLQCVFPDSSWPRALLGPDEGMLDDPTCLRLIEVLSRFAKGQVCYFHYEVIATTRYEADITFRGHLDDALECGNDPDVHATPTYWWPQDRSWLVCTDWDLKFTLVAGSAELIARLVADKVLECIEVNPKTRVDSCADELNA